MDGIGSSILWSLLRPVLIFFVICIIGICIFDAYREESIESKTIITPEIKLETDGKKVDTIYIYREQR